MSGALGTIGSLVAPIAGGFLGSGLGELAGNLFGSTASSLLTPSILADIGGGLGGAGAGALASPKNRAVGALGGGLEGVLTGPGLTNLTGLSGALTGTGQHVIPILDSLFGNAGWGRGAAGAAAAGAAGAGGAAQSGVGPMGGGAAPFTGQTAVPGSPAALGSNNVGAISTAGGAGAGGAGSLLQSIFGTGTGIGGSGLTVPQLVGLLGGGGALAAQLAQGGAANMPNAGQFQSLASEAMGNTGMANALRTGILPPGAEQYADAAYNDAAAGIKSRYASMGLSGSTMEGQDLAAAQMRTEGMKYQMASDATKTGMQFMNLADTVYGQIADYQLQQDKELQDALAAFAAAASGGGVNLNVGGSPTVNSLAPAA